MMLLRRHPNFTFHSFGAFSSYATSYTCPYCDCCVILIVSVFIRDLLTCEQVSVWVMKRWMSCCKVMKTHKATSTTRVRYTPMTVPCCNFPFFFIADSLMTLLNFLHIRTRAFQFGQKSFDSILATELIFFIRFGNLINLQLVHWYSNDKLGVIFIVCIA